MATRRKIPIGSGSYFVVSGSTLRFPVESLEGKPLAELLVNAAGNGAIVLVPPGFKFPDGVSAVRYGPLEAVDLLRRTNMARLVSNRPELKIPAALIRRAKAETLPGLEALKPFPGKLKTYYEGRGSWADTGLWVSADLEFSLEMRAPVGYVRKTLTPREAELWLEANGHEAWTTPHGDKAPAEGTPDHWRIATRGHVGEGARHFNSIQWGTGEPLPADATAEIKKRKAQAGKDAKLRDVVRKAKAVSPPTISPPRKPRRSKKGG